MFADLRVCLEGQADFWQGKREEETILGKLDVRNDMNNVVYLQNIHRSTGIIWG